VLDVDRHRLPGGLAFGEELRHQHPADAAAGLVRLLRRELLVDEPALLLVSPRHRPLSSFLKSPCQRRGAQPMERHVAVHCLEAGPPAPLRRVSALRCCAFAPLRPS
jgi:hypothetical protein